MDREVQCLIIGRAESKARVVPWPRIRHGGGETRLPSLQRDREDVKTTLSPPNFQAFKAERNFRRPIFLFERHTPFSSPSIHPRIRKYAHLTALSLPGRLLTKVFSLITRHREIYVSGGRFFSLDVSCHDFRRGVVEKTARLYDAFGTRLFLEEKLSLLLHPLCPFPEKQGTG